jgi:hypothetical protein
MSKRTWRWVTRDEHHSFVRVWSGSRQPTVKLGWWRQSKGASVDFLLYVWNAIFGIDVPTDKPIKVEFSGKQLGESSPTSGTPKRARRAGNK